MSESEERSGRRFSTTSALTAILGLVLLPVMYLLSIGPLIWLYDSGACPAWLVYAMECYVFPLDFAAESFPAFLRWLQAYAQWWR
jgi:hypothetical protein